jgi:predicted nucleic acid-binding protein
MKYVVDTHALLWYFTNDSRLGKRASTILKEAEQDEYEILIPSIVLLEAIDIGEKKRVRFNMEHLFDFLDSRSNFRIVPLDTEWLRAISQTGQGLELHDRVILTVAKSSRGIVLTKDPDIQKANKTVW